MRRAPLYLATVLLSASMVARAADPAGVLPLGEDGKPLNFDFERGTLEHWTTQAAAFDGQPVKGDTIAKRRSDMKSNHAGEYWIGTFETRGDGPRGIMQSVPFTVTHPWASLLIGGGSEDESVNVMVVDTGETVFHATGDNRENMERVAVDLRKVQGKKVFIRLIDDHSFSWGHLNFDDFRFHSEQPDVPKRVILTPDVAKHAGLPPEEAAKAITLPEGFNATLFAGEPQVNQPVGFAIDDRGRIWVAEAWTYPIRAKEGQGKDRILIFEDTDGDGKADKRTVFAEGLNLVSGIELGFGGVWVGAAPYLMFIPDKDGDDKPDGKPEILLDGWAWQDTHETLNAFNWGPDGWLYGCHGVFTHSRVGKPGTPDKERIPLNAGLWRYHPTRKVFEVFAEGSSNPWGVDFNDRGQAFITACVIPHLYHVIQGARYQRQAGAHFNPYVYRDIQNIGDHVHWMGDSGPHAGNNKSASAGGGHAHCGAMVYLADSWPKQYRDTLFMANIHGNRLNNDKLDAQGSGYVGRHMPDPVLMNDKWSRLINMKYGPDGSVYLIDWYDKQACHNPNDEIWDRTNGRVYKIAYKQPAKVNVDLAKSSVPELVEMTLHANDWYVRHARRILQERNAGKEAAPLLAKMLGHEDVTRRLRAMWALHCVGEFKPEMARKALQDKDPYVRAWAVQLAAERFVDSINITAALKDPKPSAAGKEMTSTLAELAKGDPSPVVRLYVASAVQRLPVAERWEVLEALVGHSEDKDDHNLPLMYWYAAEPSVGADVKRGTELAKKSAIPLLRQLIARRICAAATEGAGGQVAKVKGEPLAALAGLLAESSDAGLQVDVLTGMAEGLAGWASLPSPGGWARVYEKLSASGDANIRARAQELSVVFGEERALAAVRQTATDEKRPAEERRKAIESLLGAKDKALAPILQGLINDPAVRSVALRGLAAYDDPKTPEVVLKAYGSLSTESKVEALNTLASRVEYAKALKAAVESGAIPKNEISAATLRQLAALESEEIKTWLAAGFGTVRTTPEDKLKEIDRLTQVLTRRTGLERADASAGRAIFAKTCQQCHKLFNAGGSVGPDLTGSNRADLNYVLTNIIDPSAVVGKDYQMSLVRAKDGRVISGIVKKDDGNAITVQTESETVSIPKSDVVRQRLLPTSMMPEGLIAALKPVELRDLVGYLRSPRQVPMLATAANAGGFFNGKDLTNWSGDAALWSVQDGAIIGKTTTGIKKNAFLFSEMVVGDFKLTVKVMLVKNEGNSGIQFRSEPFEETEARGYQADVGPGWWGKLYEENGRKLLVDKPFEQFVKPGEWNEYEIVAVGSRVRTKLNGNVCVDIDDPDGAKRGRIAVQLHSGGPTEVRFKDLKLEVDPPALPAVGK